MILAHYLGFLGVGLLVNKDFAFIRSGSLELLAYLPWFNKGLVHGMTTSSLMLRGDSFAMDLSKICSELNLTYLALPQQKHGRDVLSLNSVHAHLESLDRFGDLMRRYVADVIIAPGGQLLGERGRVGYGVATADCVPLIVRASSGYAVIHAGWRGLANRVIEEGLKQVGEPLEVAIFGCAGGESYQVGEEVIEAIGRQAVFTSAASSGFLGGEGHQINGTKRYLLDVAATAKAQLLAVAPGLAVAIAGLCTIKSRELHSYRRDGEAAGRCVTLVVP
jgi:copper oxidase (laccase) domain-containing protein